MLTPLEIFLQRSELFQFFCIFAGMIDLKMNRCMIRWRRVALLLLSLPVMTLSAKEKCRVIITAPEGVRPYELVIEKKGVDPKDSQLRTKLETGVYECEIETDMVELQSVLDFGEVLERGHTGRSVDFFVEDGATVKVYFDGEALTVDSDGPEFLKQKRMQEAGEEWLSNRLAELGLAPDSLTEEQTDRLTGEYNAWKYEYYKENPMLAFLLDLANRLSYFNVMNHSLGSLLDLYHQSYESLYTGYKAHDEIRAAESDTGIQILGRKYHDYTAFNEEGAEVKASDYLAGKPTLVICWATWCLPCRQEAKDLVPLYERYKDRGLNAFSIAREFQSADNFRAAVAEDMNPWPTLLDLDDRFKIFDRHGVTSSALFLIDADGNIAASGYEWDDEPALKRIFPD